MQVISGKEQRQAHIIDGKAIAADLRDDIAKAVAALKETQNITPGLAVILVGEDAASQVYVRNKVRQTEAAGMLSRHLTLPADTSEAELLALVQQQNEDPAIHGILVQLPLPVHINADKVINTIDPNKDVDGFHVINAGRLMTGQPGFVPCTPLGCMQLIQSVHDDVAGLHAVVVGRSNIVGKPMAQLLLQENCTVTIAHSRTRDLPAMCRSADILVAAVGRPAMIKGDWIKPEATVIDVGINRVSTQGESQLVGDVAFDEAVSVAGAITPVPGGVGPMTIACLLRNCLTAAEHSAKADKSTS